MKAFGVVVLVISLLAMILIVGASDTAYNNGDEVRIPLFEIRLERAE